MAWLITRDIIEEGKNDGRMGPSSISDDSIQALTNGEGFAFRMLDDDSELYYEGRCTIKDSFQPLDNFGMPNAGCTMIQYRNKGRWETL